MVAAIGSGTVFMILPETDVMVLYFPAGIMVAALVDCSLRFRPFSVALAWRLPRYLGTISYGLYVFHIVAIWSVVKVLQSPSMAGLSNRPVIIVLSLGLTISHRRPELPVSGAAVPQGQTPVHLRRESCV